MGNVPKDAVVFDIETSADLDAIKTLPPVEPAKNLKDPEKIAADVIKKELDRIDKAALDPYTARVLAVGFHPLEDVDLCETTVWVRGHGSDQDAEERTLLRALWKEIQVIWYGQVVTYNGCGFDIPFLVQRSLLLNIRPARLDIHPFRCVEPTNAHWDIYSCLKTWDTCGDHPRKLAFYVSRLLPGLQRDYPADLDKSSFAAEWDKGNDELIKTVAGWDVWATATLGRYLIANMYGSDL
jgi:hypothetical protein